jgi:DNA-binding transcriptional MerR regulator
MARKLFYKIGEACKLLDIQPYVLRYWEREFPFLAPDKSRGGQRVYSADELDVIRRIKALLYEEGYTIAGAKRKLETELAEGRPVATAPPTAVERSLALVEPPAAADLPDLDGGAVDDEGGPVEQPREPGRRVAAPVAPEAGGALDTLATETIETLVAGVREALGRSREILRILGPGAP